MMEMKWIFDEENRLVATWEESRTVSLEVHQRLTEGNVCPACRTGGPPGRSRGILPVAVFILSLMSRAMGRGFGRILSFWRDRSRFCACSNICFHLRRMGRVVPLALNLLCLSAHGQDSTTATLPDPQVWNLHFQSTVGTQGYPSFPAEYTGPNSLTPGAQIKDTVSMDVMGGVRLWRGGEFFGDVVIWQGYGLSNTLGMAGFPNGEAFRIGKTYPDAYLCRAFIRETIGFGGEKEATDDEPTDLRGKKDVRNLTFTLGHLSAKDIFDNNSYANDSRTQFMNWSLMANDAWDYPADTLGFTNGAAAELNMQSWTGRLGIFQVSKVANGLRIDWNLANAWSAAGEFEKRYSPRGHAGALRLFVYDQRAHMGNYQDTLNNPSLGEVIALTAAYRYKYGFGINLEQEIRKNLGVFTRLGWSDGKNQTYEFTDVDRTATAGLSLKGARWRRPQDTVGLGVVVNGISAVHRQYLAAGGLGITIGDGALDYSAERIVETYYNWQIAKHFQLTTDYQFTPDPAYNRARGPVNLFALRFHTEF